MVPILKGQAIQEDAWPLKVGLIDCPQRRKLTTNGRWVTFQNSEDLVYISF